MVACSDESIHCRTPIELRFLATSARPKKSTIPASLSFSKFLLMPRPGMSIRSCGLREPVCEVQPVHGIFLLAGRSS